MFQIVSYFSFILGRTSLTLTNFRDYFVRSGIVQRTVNQDTMQNHCAKNDTSEGPCPEFRLDSSSKQNEETTKERNRGRTWLLCATETSCEQHHGKEEQRLGHRPLPWGLEGDWERNRLTSQPGSKICGFYTHRKKKYIIIKAFHLLRNLRIAPLLYNGNISSAN